MISNDPINIDQRDESCLPAQIVSALKIIKSLEIVKGQGGDSSLNVQSTSRTDYCSCRTAEKYRKGTRRSGLNVAIHLLGKNFVIQSLV